MVPEWLIVTPEQYAEGFCELIGGVIFQRRYPYGFTRPDGNVEVRVPPPNSTAANPGWHGTDEPLNLPVVGSGDQKPLDQ